MDLQPCVNIRQEINKKFSLSLAELLAQERGDGDANKSCQYKVSSDTVELAVECDGSTQEGRLVLGY